jgi:tetratricopeptide (TPR) repeat protein
VGSVAPVLRGAEIERARRKSDAALDTYDLTLRALMPAFSETPESNGEALQMLERALAVDPACPSANALAAWCLQQRHLMNWPSARADDREAAKRLARVAISEGADVPLALCVAGAVRAALTRDHDLALAAVDHAKMINPNAAFVLGFDAVTRCICGAYEQAIENAEKAIRLSPLEPLIYHAEFALAFASLMADRAEEAVTHALKAIEGNRNFPFPYCALVLAHARLDQFDKAGEAVRRLLAAAPGFRLGTLRKIRFADVARLHAELDLLRRARLPD